MEEENMMDEDTGVKRKMWEDKMEDKDDKGRGEEGDKVMEELKKEVEKNMMMKKKEEKDMKLAKWEDWETGIEKNWEENDEEEKVNKEKEKCGMTNSSE